VNDGGGRRQKDGGQKYGTVWPFASVLPVRPMEGFKDGSTPNIERPTLNSEVASLAIAL
jgi:hypothetical protein